MKRTDLKANIIVAGILIFAIFCFVIPSIVVTYTLFSGNKEQPTKAQTINTPTPSELNRLVNTERLKAGLGTLELVQPLNISAQIKADDMFTNKYFGHINKDGTQGYDLIFKQTDKCQYASENLTQNIMVNDSEHAISAWMGSEEHRKAILDPQYDEVGYGIAGNYIVQHLCDIK